MMSTLRSILIFRKMKVTAKQAMAVYKEAELIYSLQQVEQALDTMAWEIRSRISGSNPIVLCVMKGGLASAGRLILCLDFPLRLDYLHATRYREETSGGELHWIKQPDEALEEQTVLIVDDIFDEGITLAAIADLCHQRGAKAVYSAVLVEKKIQRGTGFRPDFIALEVEDRYVFGYGMDYKGYLRNVPGIYAVTDI